MHSTASSSKLIMGIAVTALFAACGAPEMPPPTVPPPQTSALAPVATAEPVQQLAAAPAPAPQAQPAQLPAKVAASEPALSAMQVATVSSKMSVPADLRFQFDGDALSGQSVTLYLAVVPRIAGSNLKVSIKQDPGIESVQEEFVEQKVNASAAYRKQLSVRRLANGPTELRVLVTMDMPIGSAFGYFSVPFAAAAPAAAPASKQPVERRQQ